MKSLANQTVSSCFILLTFFFSTNLMAQKSFDASQIAINHLKQNAQNWQLSDADIADVAVQYSYETAHNGVSHVFLIQRNAGIEVYNALVNVNILPSGEVFYAGNRFVSHLKVNQTKPVLTASKALSVAANEVGLFFSEKNTPLSINAKNEAIFEENSISHQKMTVKLLFFPNTETGEARLAWDLDIDAVNGSDHWTMRIDALTGAVLDKKSFTTHCSFEDHFLHNQDRDCDLNSPNHLITKSLNPPITLPNLAGKGTYRVLKLPTESPLHNTNVLDVDPADTLASPYGWHDTTGTTGAEFNITRGNNAHAFLDWRNRNTSFGDEPNGGSELIFDYPYSPYASSDSMKSAATVNLFYMNNMMHDITYRYGFDEVSGNFQQKNYTGLGKGNDFVVAQAQDGGKLPDPTLNNANFSTPVDGARGSMQMYLWGRRGLRNVRVTAPASLGGTYATGIPTFGLGAKAGLSFTPISGQVVLFNDGTTKPTEACQPSKANLVGKIAMIDRGTTLLPTCSYGRKIINAQDSGAIAVIICNNLPTTPNAFNDTFPDIVAEVRIPAVIMSSTDCSRLRLAVGNDLQVTLARNPADTVGIDFVDGDFENGIIAHEYGHGISIRLTGGPANSACLNQGEQMGEGWSDFFAMIMTAKPGDRGSMARGMGPFVLRQNINGSGIRRFPYSTDMNINPHTYNNIYLSQTSPHPIGEIWATTIWDLYWALTDKYGWDSNIKNTKSGNGKAIQLVIDGMKLQPCNPGFLDGRNAILAADRANNNGENQCLIWDVFARRGMGFDANQGLGTRATDNVESFNTLPTCLKKLKLTKTVTSNINAGDNFDVRLKLINHKDNTVTGLSLRDIIPEGASFVSVIAPANRPVSVVLPNILQFDMGTDSLRSGDSLEVIYRLKSSATIRSTAQLFENFEKANTVFDSSFVSGTRTWNKTQDLTRPAGKQTIMSANGIGSSEQLLTLRSQFAVQGTQPVVRFLHRFNTEGGNDSGIFQGFMENDTGWVDLSSRMFRNAATGPTYLTYPFKTKAFWGVQDSFVETYINLSDFVGKNMRIQFKFKSNATTNSNGWGIDDVLFFDMANYQSSARLISGQRDTVIADVLGRGTIVEPEIIISNKETTQEIGVDIYPNPTSGVLNLSILTPVESAKISLMSIEGKVLFQEKMVGVQNLIPLSISGFPAGLYFLRIETEKGNVVKKIVKN